LRSTLVTFFAEPMSHAFTFVAKRREFRDSGRSLSVGETFTNISVLLFPPSEFWRRKVSLELR